ncbi:leucine-rich repeat domain-containing protein hfw [Arctopsyche grandis]|uniref:leucine-rich repeat domain-containing protein hfw n=1 Tax=Arctopsyche grandis TaxID=121162 RepID=UPI00406D83FC
MLILGVLLVAAVLGVESRIAEELMHKEEAPATTRKYLSAEESAALLSPSGCFHASRKFCPVDQHCRRLLPHAMLCCDVDAASVKEALSPELSSGNQEIQVLHVLNATLDVLNLSELNWRRLRSISFTDGNIKQVTGEFKMLSPAVCLNLSNNGVDEIASRALIYLFNLTTLDISQNKLSDMPHFSVRERDFYLNFKDNNEILCQSVLDALKKHGEHLKFMNTNSTFCSSSNTFHWFNTTELVSIIQVELIHELSDRCIEVGMNLVNCSCIPVRLELVAGKPPSFSVGVNCSNRNLKELPETLPPNTIELDVSNNNITSLKPLSEHPSYENIRRLFADNNNIKSILDLEGTKFIENFQVLSLRSNKLKTIPTYILSDSLDRNWSPRHVYLANNYLNCDCTTTRQVKLWLLSKTNNIPDYDQVLCENVPGQLVELAESKVCLQKKDWTDYIYYVIATELLLLFGLITKVMYDYWVYKTAGYLPWPASEMPKLPCDWLCE